MSDSIKISPKHGVNPTIPVCFWCGGDKNEIALMGKIDKEDSEAPRRLITNYEPCDKCKALFSKGVHVIGVTEQPMAQGMFPIVNDGKNTFYPTGSMFVATEDWAVRFLEGNEQEHMIDNVLQKRVFLLPDEFVTEMVKDVKAEEMEVDFPEVEEDNENS